MIAQLHEEESQRGALELRNRLLPSPALPASPSHSSLLFQQECSHQVARQLWPQVPPARATDVKGSLAKNLDPKGKGELKEMEGGRGAQSTAVLVSSHYTAGH